MHSGGWPIASCLESGPYMWSAMLFFSFHAVKDEMFLRNNFQRQSAALHFASVSYTVRWEDIYIKIYIW